jgi:hypothetical protein
MACDAEAAQPELLVVVVLQLAADVSPLFRSFRLQWLMRLGTLDVDPEPGVERNTPDGISPRQGDRPNGDACGAIRRWIGSRHGDGIDAACFVDAVRARISVPV